MNIKPLPNSPSNLPRLRWHLYDSLVVQAISCLDVCNTCFLLAPIPPDCPPIYSPSSQRDPLKSNLILSPSCSNCSGIFQCCWDLAQQHWGWGRWASLGPDAAMKSAQHQTPPGIQGLCFKPGKGWIPRSRAMGDTGERAHRHQTSREAERLAQGHVANLDQHTSLLKMPLPTLDPT